MKNNSAELKPVLTQRGRTEIAVYKPQEVPAYAGNPLLEALPPILSEDDAVASLGYYPPYDPENRALPSHIRSHIIQSSLKLFVAMPKHLEAEQRFSRLLRGGYLGRNPMQAGYWPGMVKRAGAVSAINVTTSTSPPVITDAGGMAIVGFSGLGKTTTMNQITNLYPQVIHHSEYQGKKFTLSQLVWLKLQCPYDGSIKSLSKDFFRAVDQILGTNYEASFAHSRTTDDLLPEMARVGALHCTGVLIIDELQHLNAASSGGVDKMLNFFVQLVNIINLPVILIGTIGAMRILSGELRQIRRGCSQGDLVWGPMRNDEEWQLFLESIWRYQYTRHETVLTKELSNTIHDECQGITDFGLKVYFLSQVRAIATGVERITPAIVRSVCADSLRLARPVLEALRTNNVRILSTLSDVQPIDFDAAMRSLQTVPQSFKKPTTQPAPVVPDVLSHNDTDSASELIQLPMQPGKKSKPAIKSENAPGSLMGIVAQGQKRKLNSYDALKAAGLTRPATEFFEVKEAI